MENQTKTILKFVIAPLLVSLVLIVQYDRQLERDWLLSVEFFDVGQGDSFLITTYQGNQILVDGGPGDSVLDALGQKLGPFDESLDLLVLSHPHLDHFEGLIAVLQKYQMKKILMPNVKVTNAAYKIFIDAVKKEDAEIIFALQGQRIFLDDATALDILYPQSQDIHPKKNDDLNDSSIVAKLSFGKTEMLLTGDAGIEIEKELLPNFNLDVDLLKVGHHGSKHSTSEDLISDTTPLYAVIQVGANNKYGHPTAEVLGLLEKYKIRMFRNDVDGNIEFISDGTGLWKK